MSFKCDVCKKPQEPRTKAEKKVIAVRNVTYNNRNEYGDRTKTTFGEEIAKELTVCPTCARKQYNVTTVGHKTIGE